MKKIDDPILLAIRCVHTVVWVVELSYYRGIDSIGNDLDIFL